MVEKIKNILVHSKQNFKSKQEKIERKITKGDNLEMEVIKKKIKSKCYRSVC